MAKNSWQCSLLLIRRGVCPYRLCLMLSTSIVSHYASFCCQIKSRWKDREAFEPSECFASCGWALGWGQHHSGWWGWFCRQRCLCHETPGPTPLAGPRLEAEPSQLLCLWFHRIILHYVWICRFLCKLFKCSQRKMIQAFLNLHNSTWKLNYTRFNHLKQHIYIYWNNFEYIGLWSWQATSFS